MSKIGLLIIALMLLSLQSKAQDLLENSLKEQLTRQMKLGNYQTGTKYIIAIPPNETAAYGWSDSAIEIYIASAFDVSLELDIMGTKKTIMLKGGDVFTINDSEDLSYTAAECREPNTATTKTITIEASKPVSVYVLNSKNTTTDGYMAIPVEHWGNEYLHCSYYDNYESTQSTFSGGFLILGSEDNTKVQVNLRGIGDKNIATLRKDDTKSIGNTFSVKINEGEVYQIESDGLTRGQFDLSGTLIKSDKPIGVVSYHQRTVVPILASSSRDHLSSMMQPLTALSKKYAALALSRSGSTKGDLFRIMAVEENTSYSVKWYDLNTKQQLGNLDGVLQNAGDFAEISDVLNADPTAKSITGSSVFEADKPIMLMQYSYSSAWDGADYDPFMWNVTGEEQYLTQTILQAPPNKSFGENHLNIIAKDISGDPSLPGLKSLEFDGTKIVDKMPSFLSNKIPGTDLYWARFKIAPGVHEISSSGDAKFGAYIYGFKSVDSYGWPAAMASANLDQTDTVPPGVAIGDYQGNGKWTINVTEQVNGMSDAGAKAQVDSKVWTEPAMLIKDISGYTSYNFKEPYTDTEWKYSAHDNYSFNLEVENRYEDAIAFFAVYDYVGNIRIDSIRYHADMLTLLSAAEMDFGTIKENTEKINTLVIKNSGGTEAVINKLYLQDNLEFTILSGDTPLPFTLQPQEEHELRIKYYPTKVSDLDVDTLFVETNELTFTWGLKGTADDGTGINDDEYNENLTITPNPIGAEDSEIAYILPEAGSVDIRLYDMQGKFIQSIYSGYANAGKNTVSFSNSGLNSGSYLLVLKQGDYLVKMTVVVNK